VSHSARVLTHLPPQRNVPHLLRGAERLRRGARGATERGALGFSVLPSCYLFLRFLGAAFASARCLSRCGWTRCESAERAQRRDPLGERMSDVAQSVRRDARLVCSAGPVLVPQPVASACGRRARKDGHTCARRQLHVSRGVGGKVRCRRRAAKATGRWGPLWYDGDVSVGVYAYPRWPTTRAGGDRSTPHRQVRLANLPGT
jgi:hypothetical protein